MRTAFVALCVLATPLVTAAGEELPDSQMPRVLVFLTTQSMRIPAPNEQRSGELHPEQTKQRLRESMERKHPVPALGGFEVVFASDRENMFVKANEVGACAILKIEVFQRSYDWVLSLFHLSCRYTIYTWAGKSWKSATTGTLRERGAAYGKATSGLFATSIDQCRDCDKVVEGLGVALIRQLFPYRARDFDGRGGAAVIAVQIVNQAPVGIASLKLRVPRSSRSPSTTMKRTGRSHVFAYGATDYEIGPKQQATVPIAIEVDTSQSEVFWKRAEVCALEFKLPEENE